MALVNAAAALAQRGRKVLIVDFDLEAPGISTYGPFACLGEAKGVVDYVADYVLTATAPRAADFIVECKFGASSVWVMPAGLRDREYSTRLNSVDWQDLYSAKSGYLFFEDLKQQWRNENFNYVLIDSRTGHTDVGGICTRQLPDAVVIMFFPNDQNILGLEGIVKDIRDEPQALRARDIYLHFCASNVPDLDDEEHILERKLSDAKRRLGYSVSPTLIHHYNSLTLLEQSVFVLDRPDSKLAGEYTTLVDSIVSQNLEDHEGAVRRLNAIRDELRTRMSHGQDGDPSIRHTLNDIDRLHPANGEVAWNMAQVYSLLGDIESESDRLSVAIEHGVSVGMARRRRAAIARLQGRQEDALADLQAILSSAKTTAVDFSAAVELLREFHPDWIKQVSLSSGLARLDAVARIRLTEILMTEKEGNSLTITLMKGIIDNTLTAAQQERARNKLVLALISSRQFAAAMTEIAETREDALSSNNIIRVFNYAMAEWGHTGTPPKDLMAQALKLSVRDSYRDVNWYQCLALASFVCGEKVSASDGVDRARTLVNRVSGRTFSCWRYLEVSRPEMRRDLDALSRLIEGEPVLPDVFVAWNNELPLPS
jgi:MinD-like ATPase involved in chromosome partitioning or flagellar assembly